MISRVQKSTFFLLMRGCIRAGARNWVISRVVGQGGGRQFLATMEPHSRENCKTVEAEMMTLSLKFLTTLNITIEPCEDLYDNFATKKWIYWWYIEDSSDCKCNDDYCNDNDEEGDGPWKMGRVYEIDLERIKCQARIARCWLGLAMMMMMMMLIGVSNDDVDWG